MHDNLFHNGYPKNNILASLADREYELLRPHLELTNLMRGKMIYNCGDSIEYLYFPLDAVICLSTIMEDGATAEAGIIGFEGVLGIFSLLGGEKMPNHSQVLNDGYALKIKAETFKHQFACDRLPAAMLLYVNSLYIQISQTAACNRVHNLKERLCRWLLMINDRAGSDNLLVTQEFISEMLGTRRPYISAAARILHHKKLIQCSRGHIRILNRQILEENSCECYRIMQNQCRTALKSNFILLAKGESP